jgi:hypothetical protein
LHQRLFYNVQDQIRGIISGCPVEHRCDSEQCAGNHQSLLNGHASTALLAKVYQIQGVFESSGLGGYNFAESDLAKAGRMELP